MTKSTEGRCDQRAIFNAVHEHQNAVFMSSRVTSSDASLHILPKVQKLPYLFSIYEAIIVYQTPLTAHDKYFHLVSNY